LIIGGSASGTFRYGRRRLTWDPWRIDRDRSCNTEHLTREEVLSYCLAKPGAWPDEPWEGDTVAKIGSKVFAFIGGSESRSVGVKCGADRDEAEEWLPGYPHDARATAYNGHSGNTLTFGGAIPDRELLEAIDVSYPTVVAKLPKRERP
jgi:predicted DNA-binding protein (MmcQ/YjbR family)